MNRSAWAYCRVSTTKDEQELSLEQQELWAQQYAEQEGLELAIFRERASAKRTIGRKEFQRMMSELVELSAARRPGALLVTSFDRLSRDMTDTLLIARQLKELRVQLYVRDAGGVVRSDTFADRAALVGQSMGGEAENEARSNRAKASWERRRREGKPMSNKVPYGLQLRAERDVPVPECAAWVKKAFRWYSSGIGSYTISERFKAGAPPHVATSSRVGPDGKPIKRVRHPVWESNRIRKMLVQRRYRGSLIEPELFDRVQDLMATTPRWRSDRKREYPLSGAIKCAGCGRSFHGGASGLTSTKYLADGTRKTYTREPTRHYTCVVCNYRINANWLEDQFRGQIDSLVAHPADLRKWVEATPLGANKRELEREIASLQHECSDEAAEKGQQRVWQLALEAKIESADLGLQLQRLKDNLATRRLQLTELYQRLAAQTARKRTLERAQELLRNFWPLFDSASYEDKRELISAVVRALGGAKATKDGIIWMHEPQARGSSRVS
jgi:DNA invertase Pin-like site-specific DNA recombinase